MKKIVLYLTLLIGLIMLTSCASDTVVVYRELYPQLGYTYQYYFGKKNYVYRYYHWNSPKPTMPYNGPIYHGNKPPKPYIPPKPNQNPKPRPKATVNHNGNPNVGSISGRRRNF